VIGIFLCVISTAEVALVTYNFVNCLHTVTL
jgi:hypothetical protein